MKELWKDFTRFFRRNQLGISFIIGYTLLGMVLIWKKWIDLTLDRDRVLFQAFIAFGLVLFIFYQFDLDYRNRRRNILYREQIRALLEFQALLYEILECLPSQKILINRKFLILLKDLEKPTEHYNTFMSSGKYLFVTNILKRSPVLFSFKKEEINKQYTLIYSLLRYIKKQHTEKGQVKLSLANMVPISSSPPEEMSLGDLTAHILLFALDMNQAIERELEVL